MSLLAEFLLGTAGVGGGIGHDESGAAFFIQCGIEKLNPEIVGVVGARKPKGKRRPGPTESFNRSLSTALTLNGGLARTKSNLPVRHAGRRSSC